MYEGGDAVRIEGRILEDVEAELESRGRYQVSTKRLDDTDHH